MEDFSRRSIQTEEMDELDSSGSVVERALLELDLINRWLGGNAVTLGGLHGVADQPRRKLKIADLGCGSGNMLKQVARWARKRKLEVQLKGFDANPFIVDYARRNCRDFPEISMHVEDVLSKDFSDRKFDVVLCTLFLHHFTTETLGQYLGQLRRQTSDRIIINDLHRHPLAYYSISALTQMFSQSDMVKNDAPISVLRGFRRVEITAIMREASIDRYHLSWKWAFRWQLIIDCA